MFYRYSLTVPANTAEKDALTLEMQVWKGVIYRVMIMFPTGPSGLLRCQIIEGLASRWPTNSDESFGADGETVDFKEYLEIDSPPALFKLRAWNLDDTYEHTVYIRLGVLPKWALLPVGAYEGITRSIQSLINTRGFDG